MSSHPPTRAYVDRRAKEGLSKKEIIRCLKRYAAREVCPTFEQEQANARSPGGGLTPYSAAAPVLACERSVGRPRALPDQLAVTS
jgi:hypothetical protein